MRWLSPLVLLALLAPACGGGDATATSAADPTDVEEASAADLQAVAAVNRACREKTGRLNRLCVGRRCAG